MHKVSIRILDTILTNTHKFICLSQTCLNFKMCCTNKMDTKAMKHIERALVLKKLPQNKFGNGLLPWSIDNNPPVHMTMESIKSLLRIMALGKPIGFVVSASLFWNNGKGATEWLSADGGRHTSEIARQIMQEIWILALKLEGYSGFMGKGPPEPRIRESDRFYHDGRVYESRYVCTSMFHIADLWQGVPDFPEKLLEILIEINSLMNIIKPCAVVARESNRTRIKSFSNNILDWLVSLPDVNVWCISSLVQQVPSEPY